MADPLLGAAIGRYRVMRLIGEGGMGRVYEGVNPEIGSRVALKVLAAWLANDAEVAERMFAEARAVNLIQHPRIVPAIDFLRLEDGRPVIVMELVEGRSMREAITGGEAPLGGVVDVMIQVLDVLTAAHAVGVVHRDLKPDNILISREGHARVLDFGIAKLIHPTATPGPRTRTGVVLGTPLYMAPEQISGGVVDQSVDLYALGVVLYEAVTGRVPFEGATDFDVMRAHVDTPPPSARLRRADLPVELERVIECALAKHPRERFASANAMANALRVAAQALPDQAWRSLSPSAPILARPTVPTREDVLAALRATSPVGRLEVPTARVTSNERPKRANKKWVVVVAAAVAIAGAGVAVLAIKSDASKVVTPGADAASPLAKMVPADAAAPVTSADAASLVATAIPSDAALQHVAMNAADPNAHVHVAAREGLFGFTTIAGFEDCLHQKSMELTTGDQKRTLDQGEIQQRCATAAGLYVAQTKGDPLPYITTMARNANRPAFALGLIELAVRRSRAACNNMTIYNVLADVIDGVPNGQGEAIVHTKVIIVLCLKDEAFRKDFLDELQSHDKAMAARACEILTDQKLVTSCK